MPYPPHFEAQPFAPQKNLYPPLPNFSSILLKGGHSPPFGRLAKPILPIPRHGLEPPFGDWAQPNCAYPRRFGISHFRKRKIAHHHAFRLHFGRLGYSYKNKGFGNNTRILCFSILLRKRSEATFAVILNRFTVTKFKNTSRGIAALSRRVKLPFRRRLDYWGAVRAY